MGSVTTVRPDASFEVRISLVVGPTMAVSGGRPRRHRRRGAAPRAGRAGRRSRPPSPAAPTAGVGGPEVADSRSSSPSKSVLERHLDAAVGRRRWRSRRRGRGPGGSDASERLTLPWGSMSSTRTSSSSPRLRTSSTRVDALAATDLGDVEQAVAAREDVDERAELGDVDDPARVDGADLGLGRVEDELDAPARLLDRGAVLGSDRHGADPPVVVDGDVGAGLLLDGVDDLALGADDLADLVDRDLEADDLRRAVASTSARGSAIACA